MTRLLISQVFIDRFGAELARAEADSGLEIEHLIPPTGEGDQMTDAECESVDIAFFSEDQLGPPGRPFFDALTRAPNLRWLHVFHAGVDAPRYGEMMEQGVRLTTSSGSNAEPIAHTLIAGLLMLSRGFPDWITAQQDREWSRRTRDEGPIDLREQTLVIIGLGEIGAHVGRIAQAIGLHVIGVRRSPQRPGDPVDEMFTPAQLDEVLPRADWLALATPLTEQTRGMIDARVLGLLPRGARLLNVARGAVVVEPDLIAALQSGQLGGAYLDVFAVEPLPADSPLWEMPEVIITPHNSAVSAGTDGRAAEMFLDNLVRYGREQELVNESHER
ncbi:MAG TPA: D-2-hydroxyacid dehydrogenase [Dehalococcoidia bacterium]|jgi:phosphoglycerate dehydrogenase-like enzyme|nr:D-2-hydroxyacid dehydrogenase [Dehalococcoidia bacterium]